MFCGFSNSSDRSLVSTRLFLFPVDDSSEAARYESLIDEGIRRIAPSISSTTFCSTLRRQKRDGGLDEDSDSRMWWMRKLLRSSIAQEEEEDLVRGMDSLVDRRRERCRCG